jgi:hypothetical protein
MVGRVGLYWDVQVFLVDPKGQSYRELRSEDWWAWSNHEGHGA